MSKQIRQFRQSRSEFNLKWYVARHIGTASTSSLHPSADDEYLHQDGQWRKSTFHNGKPTGYYESEQAAAEQLERAESVASLERKQKI